MSRDRDPRELEMLHIVNMQPVPEEVIKGIQEIETAVANGTYGKKVEEPKVEQIVEIEEQDDNEILKPGEKIRPIVDADDAKKLAERLYGIVATDVKELISYDDRNFLIQADKNIKNPIVPNHWPHGYILKIVNTLDSKKTSLIDAQTQLLLFLAQQNIECPKPVMNIHGKHFSVEQLGETKHIVRVLEFIPGKTFTDVPKTNHLYYQAGQFIARVDNALKYFQHDALKRYKSLWMMTKVPLLSQFLYVIKDEEKKEIVEQVLEQFDKLIIQDMDRFDKGIIHGDFNEQNILVNNCGINNYYKITGVIDFGDTTYSLYVFELAITMAYMMMQSQDISTGGLVLAGYSMLRNVPEHERKILKVCVAARICQSVVLGAYSHTLDPQNDYLLTTQESGWNILAKIWAEPDDKLTELWTTTADKYLTQSTK